MTSSARVTATLLGLLALVGCDLDPVAVGQDFASSSSGGDGGDEADSATGNSSTAGTGTSADGGSEADSTTSAADSSGEPEGTTDGPPESSCDPRRMDCELDQGCYPSGSTFECGGPSGGGPEGTPCIAHEECAPGHLCGDEDDGCQTFCSTDDPESCDYAWQSCEPWFAEGAAPPGLETLGVCVGPPASRPGCNPVLQDCALGDACYPAPPGNTFDCVPRGGTADLGERCRTDAQCIASAWCNDNTCTQFCDVGIPESCIQPDTVCEPWYPLNGAPMFFEQVGTCTQVR